MKQRLLLFWTISALALFSLLACDGSDPAPVDFGDLIEEPDTPGGPDTPIAPPGDLGDLTDLGDLVEPAGDHWYFTRAVAINDDGIVIGQSNNDLDTANGAFRWDPVTGGMTFLGIHSGTYDDHYNIDYERADPRKYFIFSEAVDINQSGAIIGNSTTGAGWPEETEKRAFRWINGVFVDLTPHPYVVVEGECLRRVIGRYSEAVDINDKGEIVLTLEDDFGKRHAYYWDGSSFTTAWLDSPCPLAIPLLRVPVPVYVSLGRIVGADSEAVAINENLHAVVNSGGTSVFCDLNHGVVESLNHLPGATKTIAVDINDSQYLNNDGIPDPHIIGNSGIDDNNDGRLTVWEEDTVQGFFWDGGAMYPVDHLGGGTSEVTDMNNLDEVVGGATTADKSVHAFLWTLGEDEKGIIRDLGTLGGSNSFATGINEAGQVVGYSETGVLYTEQGIVPVPVWHAFLWDNGVMYDLGVHNDFYDYSFVQPYPFSEAVDINAGGEVAGNSITINSHYRGFYLLPDFP